MQNTMEKQPQDNPRQLALQRKTTTVRSNVASFVDPIYAKDLFCKHYPQFFEQFEDLDDQTKEDFKARANAVCDKDIGEAICSGDPDEVKEALDELSTAESKLVMKFLSEEEAIEILNYR